MATIRDLYVKHFSGKVVIKYSQIGRFHQTTIFAKTFGFFQKPQESTWKVFWRESNKSVRNSATLNNVAFTWVCAWFLSFVSRNVRVAVFGAPTTRTDRAMCELQRRGGQPMPDPVRNLPGWFPVHVALRTAHSPAAHRTAGARPRRRRRWRETVPVRPVRPELPLPFSLSQASRTKPQGPLTGWQAVHVRHMRYAVQVSCWRFYVFFFFHSRARGRG